MATDPLHRVVEHLRGVFERQHAALKPDGELLKRYVRDHDAAAFETIVRRHGPMVLGVCRRVLRNLHDAEDAFQATFLVLVRKAATLRSPATLGNWLYGVAYRTALHARDMAAKRRAKEAIVAAPSHSPGDNGAELRALLDQELERLSEKYRTLIVLCDLEGKTRKEAAALLGLPEGTVASRLAKARLQLAKRLARHGLAVSGGTLATALSADAAGICVPISLIHGTSKAALALAAGSAAGAISGQVMALTQGVLKMMLLTKLKNTTAALMLFAVLSTTAAGVAYQAGGTETHGDNASQIAKTDPAAMNQKADTNELAELRDRFQSLQVENLKLKSELAAAKNDLAVALRKFNDAKTLLANPNKRAESQQSVYIITLNLTSPPEAQGLVGLIRRTIEPASWSGEGGTGSIEYWEPSSALVVRSTKAVYDEVFQIVGLFEKEQQIKKAADGKLFQKVYPVGDLASKDGESLIRVIAKTIDPNSWELNTGNPWGSGSIEYFPEGRSLVIRHHPAIQTRIESLLADLRKAKAEQEKK